MDIRLTNVTKKFIVGSQQLTVIDNLSLHIPTHSFVAITGPSGSGKSTLMYVLGCLDVPTSGSYTLDETNIERYSDQQLARLRNQHIGFIFQRFHLLPGLSALDNVALPLLYAGVSSEIARTRAKAQLQSIDLGHRLDHYPYQLSGGQQQRVAIARALINKPSLILADEPTGSLDSKTGELVMQQLAGIHQETDCTIVLVTHEQSIAEQASRQIELHDGRLASDPTLQS